MVVVFSDVHLTDGTTAHNVHASAFNLLGGEIAAVAEKKGDLTEIHLILLGDIYDLVRTNYWVDEVAEKERPWNGTADPATAMNADEATTRTQFLAALERILATEPARALAQMVKTLPTVNGQPPRVTYVVGNHDRAFNNYAALKERLQREFDPIPVEFALKVQADAYGLLARHGHEWDGECHGWEFYNKVLRRDGKLERFDPQCYRVQAIGEAVTAELMSGLVHNTARGFAEEGWNSAADQAFLESFKDINNLRPLTAAFNWLAWFVRGQGGEDDRYLPVIREALKNALSGLLRSRLARQWDKIQSDFLVSGDLTDHLARVLALVKQRQGLKLLEGLASVAGLFGGGGGDGLDGLAKGAQSELTDGEAASETIQHVLYGHTHEAREDCFRAGHDGRVKFYVNTGTFLPFIDRARDGRGFWHAHRMTYVLLFNNDEDRDGRRGPGPTLDVWNGLRRKMTD